MSEKPGSLRRVATVTALGAAVTAGFIGVGEAGKVSPTDVRPIIGLEHVPGPTPTTEATPTTVSTSPTESAPVAVDEAQVLEPDTEQSVRTSEPSVPDGAGPATAEDPARGQAILLPESAPVTTINTHPNSN
jgi:hypothetical protein